MEAVSHFCQPHRPTPSPWPHTLPTYVRSLVAHVGVTIHHNQPPLAAEGEAVRVAVVNLNQPDVAEGIRGHQLIPLGKGEGCLAALQVSNT